MANTFTAGLKTTMALNGTALIESGSQTSAEIPNSGRAVVRLGFPTIPSTTLTFLVGAGSLSGIPPLAGFFSKDEILSSAYYAGYRWLWALLT